MKKIIFILVLFLSQSMNIKAQDESYLLFLETAKIFSESFEDELDLQIGRLEFDNLSTSVPDKDIIRMMFDSYEYYVVVIPMDESIARMSFRVKDSKGNFVVDSEESEGEEGFTTYVAKIEPDESQDYTISVKAESFKSGELTGTFMLIVAHSPECFMSERNETYYWRNERRFDYQYASNTECCFIFQGSTLIQKTGDNRVEYKLEELSETPENVAMVSATDGDGNQYIVMFKSETNTLWLLNVATNYVKVYYLAE
jgi:hypothetical protein